MKSEVHPINPIQIAKSCIISVIFYVCILSATPVKIAVLNFEPNNFPPSFSTSLTEKFRVSLSDSSEAMVHSKKSTENFSVFYGKSEDDYQSCQSLNCALEIGNRLNVNYLISGQVTNSNSTISLDIDVFSMELRIRIDSVHISTTGGIDSLISLLESAGENIGKSLTKTLQKPPTPRHVSLLPSEMQTTMLMGPRVTTAANSRSINQPIVIHGPVPGVGLVEYLITNGKIRAALLSSAIPGVGQFYSKKKWSAFSFFTTEVVFSAMAYYHHQSFQTAQKNAEQFYALYLGAERPEDIPGYKEQVLDYVSTLKHHNNWMKNYYDAGRIIWLINIAHAYYVGPETIYSV